MMDATASTQTMRLPAGGGVRRGMALGPLALLVVCWAVMNLWHLGSAPLSKTEGLRAITGHQINETGHWIVTRLYGQIYLRKPPGHAWVIAITERLTGVANEWVWRLPSAVAALGIALLMFTMARRWFGDTAGIVSGFSALAIVAVWSQNRSAEIDTLNTLGGVLAACSLIEIGFGTGQKRRKWLWAIVTALGMAIMLMVKGPAAAPLVGGAIVGASIMTGRWRWLARPEPWAGLIVGGGVFGAWAWAAYQGVASSGPLGGNARIGFDEMIARMIPQDPMVILHALTIPIILAASAFPLSASLLVLLRRGGLTGLDPEQALRARAILGTLLIATAIFTLVGIERPRYGYLIFPMLCPLVGLVAAMWQQRLLSEVAIMRLRQLATVCVAVFGGLGLTFGVLASRAGSENHVTLSLAGAACLVSMIVGVIRWVRCDVRRGAAWLVVAIVGCSVAMGEQARLDRFADSGANEGQAIAALTGPEQVLIAGEVVRNHPEVFWYAQRPVQRFDEGMEEAVRRGVSGWAVMDDEEFAKYSADSRVKLDRVTPLPGFIEARLMWMEAAAAPTAP